MPGCRNTMRVHIPAASRLPNVGVIRCHRLHRTESCTIICTFCTLSTKAASRRPRSALGRGTVLSLDTVNVEALRERVSRIPELVAGTTFTLLVIYFAIFADGFLSALSISNILVFASITGIIVVGVSVLMIGGEFDLSVGSTLAVSAYVYTWFLNEGSGILNSTIAAVLFALAVSAALGLINGLIVAYTGIPSFIATLGTLLAYRGLARTIGDSGRTFTYEGEHRALFDVLNGPIGFLNDLSDIGANFRLSILWFFALVAAGSFLMKSTRYGNWVAAVGGNRQAALSQGVPVNRVLVTNFVLTGFLAGLAGVIQISWRLSVDPLRGSGLELVVVAACVIGGVKLTGGFGTVWGAAIGILLIRVLEQGLILQGVEITVFRAVTGAFLIAAVVLNTYLARGSS